MSGNLSPRAIRYPVGELRRTASAVMVIADSAANQDQRLTVTDCERIRELAEKLTVLSLYIETTNARPTTLDS